MVTASPAGSRCYTLGQLVRAARAAEGLRCGVLSRRLPAFGKDELCAVEHDRARPTQAQLDALLVALPLLPLLLRLLPRGQRIVVALPRLPPEALARAKETGRIGGLLAGRAPAAVRRKRALRAWATRRARAQARAAAALERTG